MRQRLPVRGRGDTPIDEMGNPTRRSPVPADYGVLDGNSPSSDRGRGSGSSGLSCNFNEFGGGGSEYDAQVVFYRLPDSIIFNDYKPHPSSLLSDFYFSPSI